MNLIVKYVVQTCDTYIESNSSSTFTPKKKKKFKHNACHNFYYHKIK